MARRFRFRLQPILRLRESLEKEAQRHLARMLQFQRESEGALNVLVLERARAFGLRRTEPGAIVDIPVWKATERYLVVVERRILEAEEHLAEAIRRVDAARQALVQAHKNHLSLLRLRERRQEQHRLDTVRDEAKEADEMTVLRFRRQPHGAIGAHT